MRKFIDFIGLALAIGAMGTAAIMTVFNALGIAELTTERLLFQLSTALLPIAGTGIVLLLLTGRAKSIVLSVNC